MASADQSSGATHSARRGRRAAVAVVSDRSLVAEAVGAALCGGDLEVVVIPWPTDPSDADERWTADPDPALHALMLCDLEGTAVDTGRWLVRNYPARWLLLTDASRGPLWGAMLEAGVDAILRSSTSTAELLSVIAAPGEGPGSVARTDRDELIAAWREYRAERTDARARIASLTRREREVLRLLHLGWTVGEMAERDAVASSTIRSHVQSVLHKLELNSQLAAVAYFEKWHDA